MSDIEDEPPPVLLPCTVCSRTFRPEVLERHVKVCEKTASKKRRVFDSFKNRVSGTELEEFLGPAPLPGQAPKRPVKSPVKKRTASKWKETHENLIAVLRAARGVETASDTMLEAPKPSGNEQCPSCNRFFGPRAFDRHVEFCKEKTARIKLTPSKVTQAQERLEARTKYRAPLSIKPKLTTKEKYSPMLPRKDSSESCSTKTSPPIQTLNRNQQKPGKQISSSFSRQSPVRQSERQRSVSPTKKSSVSSTKTTVKNETSTKTSNHQPKIKENLKSPDDLRPKTGTKLTTQEKIRNCIVKLSQLEDERQIVTAGRKRVIPKSNLPSDNESVGSEPGEEKQRKSRWTSLESLRRSSRKGNPTEECVGSTAGAGKSSKRDEPKSGKRNGRQKKPLINDLSVNDESFGIFVAACSVKPPCISTTGMGLRSKKETIIPIESPKKDVEKTSKIKNEEKPVETAAKVESIESETSKPQKISKIPKAKPVVTKNREKPEMVEVLQTESPPVDEKKVVDTTTIKKKAKRWQNIAEIPTEELATMSEDIAPNNFIPEDIAPQELSESAIWEIAGEQFLKSEDSLQNNSIISLDSLEVGEDKKKNNIGPGASKIPSRGDDFIVLHVTDPAKLFDNDADMKLSISEPCFPYSEKRPKRKDKKIDIVVFTAVPSAIQSKLIHRRRKWRRTKRQRAAPKPLQIREKTFLANEIPKTKRRKTGETRRVVDTSKFSLKTPTKEEMEDRKNRFIEGLKKQREKMRKWQITASSHIKFMEEFHKGLEDDLRELKSLFESKKLKRKPHLEERKSEVKPNKKFEFFVINFDDDKSEKPEEPPKKSEIVKPYNPTQETEISALESIQTINYTNSSLENIEEVDEDEEPSSIQIEDFIVSKPNTEKILSKDGNCLEELFPKPRKISETVAGESATAVRLGYTADSLYDLRCRTRTRMLQRRAKKDSQLPKIPPIKHASEKKENSMISLIDLWKSKSGKSKGENVYKTRATLPIGKLAPLTDMNSFQIAVLPVVLKQKLSEMIEERLREESESKDSYDPFKQAERQMLALLSWPSTVDMKTAKDLTPKPKSSPPQKSNLETSPTSAFTKYPKEGVKGGKRLDETFQVNETAKKNARNEKPTYTAADDWEEIFEKHFDLNRNEMTDEMTRSVKSALDGLLRSSGRKSGSEEASSPKNRNDLTENSIITEVLYTSTPKQKSERSSKSRSRESTIDLDQTPNTYRKSSNYYYGRITPPDDFNDSQGKGRKEEKPNRNSGISLSSLSFCSQISDTTLADEEVMRSNLEIIGKAAAAAAARTPRRKYARSQSVFDERNKMLFAKTYDPNVSSSDENDVEVAPKTTTDKAGKKSPSRNPHPKSVPSHFYRSQSVVENRCKGDGDHSDDGDHVSSPESNRNRKAKLSGDSAYSSLNRRSPRQTQQNQQEDRLSSSGSDHSLPTINNDYELKPKTLDFGMSGPTSKKDQPVKMSKFCHECGSKYPVAVAKFCCECGVRRLVI